METKKIPVGKNPIIGTIVRFNFHDSKSGYSIVLVKTIDDEEVIVLGQISEELIFETLVFYGEWKESAGYGMQFRMSFYEVRKFYSRRSVIYYFCKNVRGLTPFTRKVAGQIYDHFGADTIRILNQDVTKVNEVPKLAKKYKDIVIKNYVRMTDKESDLSRLIGMGLGEKTAHAFQKKYGDDSAVLLQENPYLACEIPGVGFRKAEELATRFHIDKEAECRIRAGIKYCIEAAKMSGHTYLPKRDLLAVSSDTLKISAKVIEPVVETMKKTGDLFYANGRYSDPAIRQIEREVAAKALRISKANTPDYTFNLSKVKGIRLDDTQMSAVKKALKNSFALITGGPGTGKTTLIRAIIAAANGVLLAAPTGKAAKRMEESTGVHSCTIHRLLGAKMENDKLVYEYNKDNPLNAETIIIDETSMLDIEVMYNLLMAVREGTKLIFAGDIDQLPSVGPGQCLNDLINSGAVTLVHLTKIYRQGEGSGIPVNSKRINEGILPESTTDFYISEKSEIPAIKQDTLGVIRFFTEKYRESHPEFLQKELQVLCPMKKGELGTMKFNKEIQAIMNPPSSDKKELKYGDTIFREGDKVMHIRNDYSLEWKSEEDEGSGVFNGDTGIIKEVFPKERELVVSFFDGKEARYDSDIFNELVLSYAITIHKSQGSEYQYVLMPIADCGMPGFINRRLIYTGVTRARNRVRIISSIKTLKNSIKLSKYDMRYTNLFDDLVEISEEYKEYSAGIMK